MLYNLVQTTKGKKTVVMTGELSKVRARLKALRDSTRGGVGMRGKNRVEFAIEPADEADEKYRKPPADTYLGGANRGHPRVPKK